MQLDHDIMPRKPKRPRRPPPLDPAAAAEVTVVQPRDLADRRDLPAEGHANVSPDDRAPGHSEDIEGEGAMRVDLDADASVVERVTRHVDIP